MIKLGISGAKGRMGQTIAGLAAKDNTFTLTTLLEHPEHPDASGDFNGVAYTLENNKIADCDAVIEFTLPDGTLKNLNACVEHKVPMIIGTTGFTDEGVQQIKEASKIIPIVFASNMSIGVNVFFKITELVGKKLKDIQNIKVYEEHHIHKKDSPSGTAKTIAEIAEKASQHKVSYAPEPLREGEIIGNHDITFETSYDTLKMSHHAKERAMFALGALTATKFLVGKEPQLFNMQQVLGLDSITI
jgi:4-hydroxy-tetrahydrodipicolinate reductase